MFFLEICLTCNVCDVRDGDPKSDTARDKLALESLAHQILWCQKVLHTRYSDVKESCTPDTWILKCLAHQIPLCQNFITDQILWCQSGITEQKDPRPTSVLLDTPSWTIVQDLESERYSSKQQFLKFSLVMLVTDISPLYCMQTGDVLLHSKGP